MIYMFLRLVAKKDDEFYFKNYMWRRNVSLLTVVIGFFLMIETVPMSDYNFLWYIWPLGPRRTTSQHPAPRSSPPVPQFYFLYYASWRWSLEIQVNIAEIAHLLSTGHLCSIYVPNMIVKITVHKKKYSFEVCIIEKSINKGSRPFTNSTGPTIFCSESLP